MEFVIWVETRLAGKTLEVRQVASLERSASGIEPEELGLTLQDHLEASSGKDGEQPDRYIRSYVQTL
jgi:hypothetical protein